jgi:hypothetical protein
MLGAPHPLRGEKWSSTVFSKYADEHRPERPVLLAVDEQLGEGAVLRVPPELADPVGPLEVGEHQDVEHLGASRPPDVGWEPGEQRTTRRFLSVQQPSQGYVSSRR